MRIAATADLHFTPQRYAVLRDQLSKIRDDADLLVLAGDLTNYGQPAEMGPLVNGLVRVRVPTVGGLGNYDYESGREAHLMQMMRAGRIKGLGGRGCGR